MKKGDFIGGKARHPSRALTKYIKERDNYICQLCGSYGNQIDHIVPFAICRETKPDNLRTVCVKCNHETRQPRKNYRLPLDLWFLGLERELAIAHQPK